MDICTSHPTTGAAWRCLQCGRGLCEECAFEDFSHKKRIARCCHCRGIADLVRVYQDIPGALPALRQFIQGLPTLAGTLPIVFLAITLWFCSLIPYVGGLVVLGLWVGWYLLVIRSAGSGKLSPPDPSVDELGGIYGSVWRLFLGTWWVLLPMIGFWSGALGGAFRELGASIGIAACLLVLPAGLVVAASVDSTLSLLNPWTPFRIVIAVGWPYMTLVLVWGTLVAVGYVTWIALDLLAIDRIPVLGGIVQESFRLVPWTLSAFVLGWFVHEHAELLGLRTHDERMIPAFPNADPRGARPPALAAKPKGLADETDPMDLVDESLSAPPPLVTGPDASLNRYGHHDLDSLPMDEGVIAAGGLVARVQSSHHRSAEEMPVDGTVTSVSLAASRGISLDDALQRRDAVAAADAWNALVRNSAPTLLAPSLRLATAELLIEHGRLQLAATILRGIVAESARPESAEAAVALADLLAHRAGRRPEAIALLQAFTAHSPNPGPAIEALQALLEEPPPVS